jgi:hypothetical protein
MNSFKSVHESTTTSLRQAIDILTWPAECWERFLVYDAVWSSTIRRNLPPQAVRYRLPTAAARVPSQVRSCGIYVRVALRVGFLRVLFPLPILIPSAAPYSSSYEAGTAGQIVADVPSLTQPHSLMELSPSWEAVNCAATEEFPSILWNPKVHYRVHKSPPGPYSEPDQSNPSHPISVRSVLILSTHLRLSPHLTKLKIKTCYHHLRVEETSCTLNAHLNETLHP